MTASIYRDRILDHYNSPEHGGAVDEPDMAVEVDNPHCGDELRITAQVSDGRFAELRFEGEGCALSIASADLLLDALEGEATGAAREVDDDRPFELLGLSREDITPMRMKCVLLARDGLVSMVTEDDA